ncbi:hypothetical protein [Pseudomonas helleri]|uniref:hypothetical protein n=1 Tax=Pseudomonas helleri TaxID=1608996 RepID=UPI0030D9BFB4
MHLLVPQYQHGVVGPHAAVHVAAGFLVVAMVQKGARRGVQVGHAGQQAVTQINTGMVRRIGIDLHQDHVALAQV